MIIVTQKALRSETHFSNMQYYIYLSRSLPVQNVSIKSVSWSSTTPPDIIIANNYYNKCMSTRKNFFYIFSS